MTHTNAHKSGYKGQHINSLKYTYKARTVPGAGTTAENETDHTRSSRRVRHTLGLRVAPTDAFGGLALWRARDVCTVHTVPQFIAQVMGPGLEPPLAPAHSGPTPTGFGLRTTFPRNPSGGAHYDPDGGLQCDLGGSGTAGELVAVREEVGAR